MAGKTVIEDLLEKSADLDYIQDALSRERVIRDVMASTGEDRQTVLDAVNASRSMDQEAVLNLTEGEPTSLHDALARFAGTLHPRDMIDPEALGRDLDALLTYPYPQSETNHTLRLTGADANALRYWLGRQGETDPFRAGRIRFEKEAGSNGAVVRTWPLPD